MASGSPKHKETYAIITITNGPSQDPWSHIGYVERHADGFKAFAASGALPGRFADINTAADAIWSDCLGVKSRSNGGDQACAPASSKPKPPPGPFDSRVATEIAWEPDPDLLRDLLLERELDREIGAVGAAAKKVRGGIGAAVAAAIAAYEKSGHMRDAALAYASYGFPVFPLTVDKTPVPARDRDANGKPIPGTGSFKKATTDPIQIRAWWKHHE